MPTSTETNSKVKKSYLAEVKTELKKVHWPSREELSEHTLTVILMVVATAVFIFAVDTVVGKVVEKLIGIN